METKVSEIANGIFRLSTLVPEIAPPAGFTFNQFLIKADQPLLFHCGPRHMFESVSRAAATVIPIDRLRWVSFGHVEADECGSMNAWLAAAPQAKVVHGMTACMVSLNDLADRPPEPLADGTVLDLGGKRVRYIDTPHVPHAWESGTLFEETTQTLLCGDLFTHFGNGPALTGGDIVQPAIETESAFNSTALTPSTAPTIAGLAKLQPKTLALMHGSSYEGDCSAALQSLAQFYGGRIKSMMALQ